MPIRFGRRWPPGARVLGVPRVGVPAEVSVHFGHEVVLDRHQRPEIGKERRPEHHDEIDIEGGDVDCRWRKIKI